MRCFLAPLYFSGRFCRNCARVFYSQNPDGWIWQLELEGFPPLGRFVPEKGFIPDYSVLLMFEEFVIDGEAVERIRSQSAPPWLGEWPEVIDALSAEGSITEIDAASTARDLSHERGWLLRKELADVNQWAIAMLYHDALTGEAHRALVWEDPSEAKPLQWQYDPDNILGVQGSDGHTHTLAAAPLTDPGADPSDPHHQLHGAAVAQLRQQLREVNSAVAVSTAHDAVPMVWAPYRKYLEVPTSPIESTSEAPIEAGRLFFETAFPQYRPETVKRFSKMRADSRIGQLRSHITEASETGELEDPRYPQRILEEVIALERRIGKMRKITACVAGIVGSIPIPGVGAAGTVIGEAAASLLERHMKKPKAWFYLASDGTGLS